MADILFIKTSSLGDVIHHMPAVTEAHRHRGGDRVAWMVEEAFAPLVRLHPAVGEVIPVAWRRWRKSLYAPATLVEMRDCLRGIRARRFDIIVDSQGLVRSALMARVAHGQRHGYDRNSIREPFAAGFYDVRHAVAQHLHAVERNRVLSGLALGYAPQGEPDYGLDRARLATPGALYAVLLHATARPEKEWPEESWIALGKVLGNYGLELVLPWGSDTERTRAERIASAVPRARVSERMSLDAAAKLIAGAAFVVGVDTGLMHLAAALDVPVVAIFTGSRPGLTGPRGSGAMAVIGSEAGPPSVAEAAAAVERIAR